MIDLIGAILGGGRQSLTPSPSDDYWYNPVGLSSAAGVRVDERTALNYSACWAATRIICETIAQLPLTMFERLPSGGKQEAAGHPVFRLTRGSPNIDMTNMIFREVQTARMVNWGNAYAEIERTRGGVPINLWPIHPSRVKISDTKKDQSGHITYFVTNDNGGKTPIEMENMFHLVGANSDDGLFGRGVVRFGRESIGMGLATERYGAGFFGNGARPGGVLEHPGKIGEVAQKNLRESWNRVHQGPGSGHNLAILEEGMTYHAIDIPPEQAQFLGTRQFNITEIARWYNLPPHKLAELSRATFSNIENQALEFKESLLPWMVKWAQECWRKLLTKAEQERFFFEHVLIDLLQADTKARTEYYTKLFDRGVFSVNDIRHAEHLNPIGPEGDLRFVPMNYVPLHKAEETAQATIDAKKNPPTANDGDEPDEGEGQVPAVKAKKPKKKPIEADDDNSQFAVMEAFDALVTRVEETLIGVQMGYRAALQSLDQTQRERRQRQIDATERAVAHQIERMLSRESNEATRAAKKPADFFKWLGAFYETQAEYFRRDLRPSVAAWLAACDSLRDPDDVLADLIDAHIARSRHDLIEASGVQPEELATSVTATVQAWSNRSLNLNEFYANEQRRIAC